MRMWKNLVALGAIFCFCSCNAFARSNSGIRTYVESYLPRAHVGVVVLDRDTGKVIYRDNALKYFVPASSTKLFVLASVLKYIPHNFHYETILSYNDKSVKRNVLNGDLMLTFSGDPSLTTGDLDALVASLPFKEIKGHIIINNRSHFIGATQPPGRSYGDLPWYYAAETTGIALDRNMLPVYIKSSEMKKPAVFQYNKNSGVIINNATTVGAGNCGFAVSRNTFANSITVSGCFPARSQGETVWKFAVPSSVLYAQNIFAGLLKSHKIKFSSKNFMLHADSKDFSHRIVHKSAAITDIVKRMGRNSDDFYAESLLKTLGYLKMGAGSFGAGAMAVKTYAFTQLGIRSDMLRISDGEGTRYNMATPMQIADLLYAVAHDDSIKDYFTDALSESGADGVGTLHARMGMLQFKGTHFFGKTGTLMDASSLSGYLDAGDKHYIVVVISNGFVPQEESKVKQLESNIIQWISKNGTD